MALSQSALLEVLDALKVSDSADVIRQALQAARQIARDWTASTVRGARGVRTSEGTSNDKARTPPPRVQKPRSDGVFGLWS